MEIYRLDFIVSWQGFLARMGAVIITNENQKKIVR